MFAGFCFNNIFWRHKFWLHDSFLSAQSRNEEMMGDGFLVNFKRRFVLNSKRLVSTSCNKLASAVDIAFFSWCIPDAF